MINYKGQCRSCGRNFKGEQLEGNPCPATDDCPSHFEELGKANINHLYTHPPCPSKDLPISKILSPKDKAINSFKESINHKHNTDLSFEMCEHYFGSDMRVELINEWASEVQSGFTGAATAVDVKSLWDER